MPAGADDDQGVRQEDPVLEGEVLRRTRHDVEVVQVLAEAFDDAVPVEHLQRDVHARMRGAEGAEEARDEVLRGADQGDAQAPAFDALQRGDLLAEGLPFGMHGPGGGGELPPRFGQVHRPADDLMERQADLLRELPQVHRGGRLGHPGLARGPADAAGGDEGPEDLELTEGDVHRF